jgi:uncharacterized protein
LDVNRVYYPQSLRWDFGIIPPVLGFVERSFMRIVTTTLCLLVLGCSTTAVKFPEPRGYINDHAGVMKRSDVQKLNAVITELKQKTGAELAFLILQTVKPSDIDSYINELIDRWPVGDAKKNNGVLVVVAIEDRQWAVRTGYGLEGDLPDSKVGQMGQDHLSALFKQQKYSKGVVNFSTAILEVIARKYDVTLTSDTNE